MNRHNLQAIRKLKQEFAAFQARLNAILAEIEHQNNIQSCSLPEVQACIETVCRHYRINIYDVIGPRRLGDVALARQVAMYLCRKLTDYREERVGDCFNRDRNTVAHAVTAIQNRIDSDPAFKAQMEAFLNELRRQP